MCSGSCKPVCIRELHAAQALHDKAIHNTLHSGSATCLTSYRNLLACLLQPACHHVAYGCSVGARTDRHCNASKARPDCCTPHTCCMGQCFLDLQQPLNAVRAPGFAQLVGWPRTPHRCDGRRELAPRLWRLAAACARPSCRPAPPAQAARGSAPLGQASLRPAHGPAELAHGLQGSHIKSTCQWHAVLVET